MNKFKDKFLYLLLLVPTATEILETGYFPTTLRSIITDIVMTLIVLILVAFFNKKKEVIRNLKEEVRKSEQFDPLTRLPTRKRFDEELNFALQQAKDKKSDLRLACIDVEHFKTINEHYGSAMGDDILKDLVKRIRSIIPENSGRLYRLGGDTFALLFSEDASKENERVIASLVTLNASGDKLLSDYKSAITVGTAKLKTDDTKNDIWKRAVKDMRKKRQNNEQDAA